MVDGVADTGANVFIDGDSVKTTTDFFNSAKQVKFKLSVTYRGGKTYTSNFYIASIVCSGAVNTISSSVVTTEYTFLHTEAKQISFDPFSCSNSGCCGELSYYISTSPTAPTDTTPIDLQPEFEQVE